MIESGSRREVAVLKTRAVLFTGMAMVVFASLCIGGGAADGSSAQYRVGPEDVIAVTVVRHPEFSGDYYIPTDGNVNLPAVGPVEASGKTLDELTMLVTDRLRERLRNPEVTVTLKTARMQRVYVLGVVKNPGLYDVKPGWRITEAVAAAGGLAPGVEEADCSASILRATTGERRTVKLTDVMRGVPDANSAIESGDVLTLESQQTMPVYVVGQVKNPGLYRLRTDGSGVMEALTVAGGMLEDAALSRVAITHVDGTSETANLVPAIFEGKQGPKISLRAGDLVTVPEERLRIAVMGYVNEPGFFPVRDGQKLVLTDALGLAKGVDNKDGKLSQVAVIRTREGKQERLVYDLSKFLKSGDAKHNPDIVPGDVVYVPRRSGMDWDTVLRSISSVGLFLNPLMR